MSWMQSLYQTYDAAVSVAAESAEVSIMPVSHTLQNAHINIVINAQGQFQRARVLKKTQIVLPATESSASRGNGDFPHPLADKIQYIAKDYPNYGGRKPTYFVSYAEQLKAWSDSNFIHWQAQAVLAYVTKGEVVKDLIAQRILYVDEAGVLLNRWASAAEDAPEIFANLPKKEGETEQGDAMICWTVERVGDPLSDTWRNPELQQAWINFEAASNTTQGLCYVSGDVLPLASNHPAKLRYTGDKAKLVSSNDDVGFTYRGKFLDSNQATNIGYEVTQKAHNVLRWLIAKQPVGLNEGQAVVLWAAQKPNAVLLNPMADSYDLYGDEDDDLSEQAPLVDVASAAIIDPPKDYSSDLGLRMARQILLRRKGYQHNIDKNSPLSILALDSATLGRMGITYYRECLSQEHFDAEDDWYERFAWYQRHTHETGEAGKKKPKRETVWVVLPPSPFSIAQAAYGDTLTPTLKKQVYARILPSIVEKRPFPQDIVDLCVQRACKPSSCDAWEWERDIGVACALYRGFSSRLNDQSLRRNYTMALDPSITSRDYLYGRLLAVAERLEQVALFIAKEGRRTTAERYMQKFAARPYSTWLNIYLALDPYKARLNSSRAGFLTLRENEITDILNLFQHDEYCNDSKLSGEFLLGYHCQKMSYRKEKGATGESIETTAEVQA
jgi:CRISPR-associated protein Csd1